MAAVIRRASTIVLVAPTSAANSHAGRFAVCFVLRSAKSAFMPSLWVFPGGVREPADMNAASSTPLQLAPGEDVGDRAAALRECFEETGILLVKPAGAVDSQPISVHSWASDADHRAARRESAQSASSFYAKAKELSLHLPLADIVPWSRWITPKVESATRRFDTLFYIAPLSHIPTERVSSPDAQETSEIVWLSPQEALSRAQRGTFSLAPPTAYVLNELASCADIAAVVAQARRTSLVSVPVCTCVPVINPHSFGMSLWCRSSHGTDMPHAHAGGGRRRHHSAGRS